MFAGTVIDGFVVSMTVTVNVLLELFACASVAEHVTVVTPKWNVEPLAGVHATATGPSKTSVAEAVNVNGAPAGLVASTLAFAGTVTAGPLVSDTVTVNDALRLLPRVSVAEQLTVVAPKWKVDPLAGVQLTVRLPSTRSVADAEYVKVAPAALVASTVAFGGTVMVGAVVSDTVTVNVVVLVLLCASVALHVTVVVPSGNVEPLAGAQLTVTLVSTVSDADAVNV